MYLSQYQYTPFWRIYVAETIYPLRPESFCIQSSANWKVTTFFWQSQKNPPRLESFYAYLQNWLKIDSKYSISLEGFQTALKYIGNFPDSLERFQRVWKQRQSGKLLDSVESLGLVRKVSGGSGKFSDSLESSPTVGKVFGQSGRFLTRVESFWTIWKVYNQSANPISM